MIIPIIIPPEEKPPNMVGCAGSEKNEFGIWVCMDAKQLQSRIEQIKIEKDKPIDWTMGTVFLFLVMFAFFLAGIIQILYAMYGLICDHYKERAKNR